MSDPFANWSAAPAPAPAPAGNDFGNFDAFNTKPPAAPATPAADTNSFGDFGAMNATLPVTQQPPPAAHDDFFAAFAAPAPAVQFAPNQPAPQRTTKPVLTAQTSSEFDSIFNGSFDAAPAPAPPSSHQSPTSNRQSSFNSNSSFDNFDTRATRAETNTAFVDTTGNDFFNAKEPQSIVDGDSRRWSVGGSFAEGGGANLGAVSDDDDGSDDDEDGVMEAADPTMFHAPPANRQASELGGGRSYSITFSSELKLGMLLERHDEWVQGDPATPGKLKECTLVKLVVEHGAADVKGITLGSRVMSVNGMDCKNLAYLDTLNLVKTTPRPMTVVLQEGKLAEDECITGYCLLRKSVGPLPPSSFATWKRRYFVLGGAVANKNVLQVYKSKRDYEHVVVSLFERKPINVKLKAYKLTTGYRVSSLKSIRYSEVGANVFYFTLMTSQAKFKMIKFASDNADQIRELHKHVVRFTGVN